MRLIQHFVKMFAITRETRSHAANTTFCEITRETRSHAANTKFEGNLKKIERGKVV